ncbi:thiaminase II/PqqC family protein [Wolbachia endosymbiont of Dipetalonema caudispina]|uniref:hypothetical protein n=1 Tax=Wolbachia endosymbiont of Dipetalonema caudispina TaxID=1812112 RepID=UPI002105072B|nr:hypothetical protein [Wolbachia endosymbiont of Dipetalonema caudispina]
MFIQLLDKELNDFHLLKHQFYHLWSEGKLSLEVLQIYAKEYYHHVATFSLY